MASLLSRIKGAKKKAKPTPSPAEDVVGTSDPVEDTNERTGDISDPVEGIPSVQLPLANPLSKSDVMPVVEANSIFSGLHLSSTVADSESPDPPYMKEDPSGKTSWLLHINWSKKIFFLSFS